MSQPQQLGFDQMPKRLFRATPTRLLSWLDCPRRYRFTYLDRPTPQKGPPWAHNSLGACVHTALASWWRLSPERRTADAAGALLVNGWIDEGYRDRAQSLEWRERARVMVTNYVAQLDPTDEPVGIERTVAMKTSGLALSGRIDRIDARVVDRADPDSPDDSADHDGASTDSSAESEMELPELVVVDYKTGRRHLATADARSSLALAVYAAATARTLRRRCRRVELHHLPTGQVIAWDHTDDTDGSLQRHLSRAEAIGAEAQRADEAYAKGLSPGDQDRWFPPQPGALCRWCDFSAHCPEGRSVYPTGRPWDALASSDDAIQAD